MRGEAGALRAERFFDDLDQDFLPFFQQVLDPRLLPLFELLASAFRLLAPAFCLLPFPTFLTFPAFPTLLPLPAFLAFPTYLGVQMLRDAVQVMLGIERRHAA